MNTLAKLGFFLMLLVALPAQANLVRQMPTGPMFSVHSHPLNNPAFGRFDWSNLLSVRSDNHASPRFWRDLAVTFPEVRNHGNRGHQNPLPDSDVIPPEVNVWEPPVFGLMLLGLVGIAGMRKRISAQEAF